MNARLFCKTGPLAGSDYHIGEEATIGQQEQNDITLQTDAVSDRHARIFFDDEAGCYVLEDLGSSNGTQVDATEAIHSIPLKDLHIVTLADSVDFIFQVVAEEGSSASTEEGAKTQFGMAPESPSDLPGEGELEGERTRHGEAPGALPNLPEEASASESAEGSGSEEDRTRFGEAPPEIPDFSAEDQPEEEPDAERTRSGEAPGTLPDLSGEASSSEKKQESSFEDDRTRFGDSPPEVPDFSEEDETEGEHTQFGGAPEELPDRSEEEPSSEEEGGRSKEGDRTQFGEAPGALPDLPGEEYEKEETETDEEAPPSSQAPTRAVPGQKFQSAEPSPQYVLQVILEGDPQDTHPLPEGEITIGRSTDCDVHIKNPGVSREHARLLVKSDRIVVEDIGSKNFTFVDGDRLTGPTTLTPGAEIQFGLEAKAVLKRASS